MSAPQTPTSSAIRCHDVCKLFGDVRAVCGVHLNVDKGRFMALLGPSACGKTTALRLLAGFEMLDRGEIFIGDRKVGGEDLHLPPEKRNIGMVFQEYALFPHMNVELNVGYGLKKGSDRARRVDEVLELVGLSGQRNRMPYELSGGQQQRVALARALAPNPDVILLDEPFSSLDTALRTRVRSEIRQILRQAHVTAIFVTHDQEEALSLADDVAVMLDGRIVQTGTPQEVYRRPATRDVATFLGEANLIDGHSTGNCVSSEIGELVGLTEYDGAVEVMFRPEELTVKHEEHGNGTVLDLEYFGHDQLIEVQLDNGKILQCRTMDGDGRFNAGEKVRLALDTPVNIYPKKAGTCDCGICPK